MSEIKGLIILLLVGSLFIVATTTFVGSQFQGDENVGNISYMDKSSETMEKIEDMQSNLQSGKGGAIATLLTGGYKVIIVTLDSFDIFKSLGYDIAKVTHIPVFFVDIILGIITIIIIFGIVHLIFGRS